MRDFDLGPNDYRKQNPRTGRWRLPDDRKLCRNMFFVSIAMLLYVFVEKDQIATWTLFGCAAIFSFAGGIMFAIWLKDVP